MKKIYSILRWLIIIFIFAGIGYLIFAITSLSKNDSYTLEYGNIDIEVESIAFFIREETVVQTNSSGQVQYLVAEGEKIKNNQMVAQIQGESNNSEIDEESVVPIEEAEIRIDIEKLNYDISYLISKIKYSIINDKYSDIYSFRNELVLKLDKRTHLSDFKIDSAVVSEYSNDSIVKLLSPLSGVVSYYIDGYEDILVDKNIYSIDFIKLLDQKIEPVNKSTQHAKKDDVIYKIINGNYWKIVALIDPYYQDFFIKGNSIYVMVNDEKVSGQVVDVISQGEKIAILIEMKQLVNDFQKIRKVNIKLIPSNYKGLMIKNSSLVKKEGKYGVYVLNVNNQANFVLVKIIGYNEDFAIVVGDSFSENGKFYNTVSFYDEVLLLATPEQP